MAYRRPEFAQVFAENYIQLRLKTGDALFFNPALFHAAGENHTTPGPGGIDRSANLMQVSACWSRPMETVNRDKILRTVWNEIKRVRVEGGEVESLIKAVADGYSFPTNLDRDLPPPEGVSMIISNAITGDQS
jgi:ectoine hydroxylase-related dioxygenase (phytanoyl-CoA dioxygenase family)